MTITTVAKADLSKNQILAGLTKDESARLLPHLESVKLIMRDQLGAPGDLVRYLYFPQDSMISVLASMEDGRNVEVGVIGNEGCSGMSSLLGAKTDGNASVVQIPGGCLRIKLEVAQAEFNRHGSFYNNLLRYIRYLFAQVSQTAACNRIHLLEQRLARWLLVVQDRVKKNAFPITHEFLSHMLGTPRSEVTLAASGLRKAGLIHYERGQMTILDLEGLERSACECYRIVRQELSNPR